MKKIKIFYPLPKRIRPLITKYLINWSAKKPDSKNPFVIQVLQYRKRNAESIEKAYLNMQPPIGSKLELLTIRLIEIYHLEQQDSLLSNLNKLFPDNHYFQNIITFQEYFDQLSKSISVGGWTIIGTLYKGKKPSFVSKSYSLPKLPPEVDFIDIYLHKAFPSLIILTFDVHFSKGMNEKFKEIHDSKNIVSFEITNISISKKQLFSSSTSVDRIIEKNIIEYSQNLQQKIEACLQPYFKGEFLTHSKQKNKMPVLQIYVLTKPTRTKQNFINVLKKSSNWLESYSIHSLFGAFLNNKIAFYKARSKSIYDLDTPNRLILLRQNYLSGINLSVYGNKEDDAIINHIKGFLDDMLIPLALIEYLRFSINRIESMRMKIFNTISINRFFSPSLKKQLEDYNKFNSFSRNIERLLFEYEQNKKYIFANYSEMKIEDLKYINFSNKNIEINLQKEFQGNITNFTNIIQSHLDFISDKYSKFIETQNITVIYRLQNLMLWITLIALIVTMVSVLTTWEKIPVFIHLLLN